MCTFQNAVVRATDGTVWGCCPATMGCALRGRESGPRPTRASAKARRRTGVISRRARVRTHLDESPMSPTGTITFHTVSAPHLGHTSYTSMHAVDSHEQRAASRRGGHKDSPRPPCSALALALPHCPWVETNGPCGGGVTLVPDIDKSQARRWLLGLLVGSDVTGDAGDGMRASTSEGRDR